MNLKQLEAFVEVAKSHSFSGAARKLFLTQPTISAHITSLEKELDARLLVRNTKEVSLSEDGQVLYEYARQMIDIQETIERRFLKQKESVKKCVAIAASTIPSQYLLPKVLARFNKKYPGEQIKITEADSAAVVDKVADHLVDIGFTGTVLEKKHCRYHPFYKDELVLIAPNTDKYRVFQEKPDDIAWISGEPFIMREEGSGTRKEAEKQLKHAGIDVERLEVIASIDNPETIKRSVGRGMGISVLSRLAAEDQTREGKILAFSIPYADGGRDINAVYNKNYHLSLSAERFLKVVKEVYQTEP